MGSSRKEKKSKDKKRSKHKSQDKDKKRRRRDSSSSSSSDSDSADEHHKRQKSEKLVGDDEVEVGALFWWRTELSRRRAALKARTRRGLSIGCMESLDQAAGRFETAGS